MSCLSPFIFARCIPLVASWSTGAPVPLPVLRLPLSAAVFLQLSNVFVAASATSSVVVVALAADCPIPLELWSQPLLLPAYLDDESPPHESLHQGDIEGFLRFAQKIERNKWRESKICTRSLARSVTRSLTFNSGNVKEFCNKISYARGLRSAGTQKYRSHPGAGLRRSAPVLACPHSLVGARR